jgi:hypothetical protein
VTDVTLERPPATGCRFGNGWHWQFAAGISLGTSPTTFSHFVILRAGKALLRAGAEGPAIPPRR